MKRSRTKHGPLQGIRVIDMSRLIAGPYCGTILADLGAEVIKVEPPGGEIARYVDAAIPAINGEAIYALVYNHNKKAITLNWRLSRGRRLLRQLVAKADVLIENFRPGVLELMGLSPRALHRINPQLVIVRISGFGQTGPLSQRLCLDPVAQAMGGLQWVTGFKDGQPVQAGTVLADLLSGVYAIRRHNRSSTPRAHGGRRADGRCRDARQHRVSPKCSNHTHVGDWGRACGIRAAWKQRSIQESGQRLSCKRWHCTDHLHQRRTLCWTLFCNGPCRPGHGRVSIRHTLGQRTITSWMTSLALGLLNSRDWNL